MTDYEQLRAALDKKLAADPSLRAVMKRVKNGAATLTDSAEYARVLSHILGREVSASILDLDDRESAVTQLLHDSYDDVNSIYAQAQTILDEQAGIHITPQKPIFPAERVKQFAHSLIDPTVKDSIIKRRARAGTETITKSFHDNCIKVNAQFRHDAGLKCYIVRIGTKCCDWCTEVAGKYKFGEQPDGIFRRHDNCDCTIIYDGQVLRGKQNADGSRSKTWEELPNANAADYTAPTLSEAEGRAVEQRNLAQIRGLKINNSSIDNYNENGIISTGGKIIETGGKINDNNFLKATEFEKQAQAFYDARIRNGNDDVSLISKNTGFKYDDVLLIKKHIMEEEHLFDNGSVRKFEANIDQALAWQRMMENRATDTDILLLKHELRELRYMKKTGCSYEKAHAFSNQKYDWQTAVDLLNDNDNLNPDLIK